MQFSFTASLLLNALVCVLVSQYWMPATTFAPVPRAHMRVAIYQPLPRPVPTIQTHRTPPIQPAQRPVPKPLPKPIRPATTEAPSASASRSVSHQAAPRRPKTATRPTRDPASAAPAPTVVTRAAHTIPVLKTPEHTSSTALPMPIDSSVGEATPPALPTGTGRTGEGSTGTPTGTQTGSGDGTGKGQGSGSGEPFGVGGDGTGAGLRHIVYLLDVSLSMESRLNRVKSEMRQALTGLQPGESFDIIVFADTSYPFDHDLVPANAQTVAQADHFLDTIQLRAYTNLESALTRALTMPGVNVVVVMTDGVPTVGETDFGKLARRIRALNRTHARIYTVGLVGKNPDGTDDSFEATHLLQQIARDSHGEFRLVSVGDATP